MSARPSASLARTLALLLAVALFGCRQSAYETRRPWAEDAQTTDLNLHGMKVRGRVLAATAEVQQLSLGNLAPGELMLYAAVEGGASDRVSLHLAEPPGKASCPLTGGLGHWQICRLPIAASARDGILEVRSEAAASAKVFVSSPIVRTLAATPRPPVFVILADTLRFDRIASYTPDMPLGRRIDQLARDGIVFEQAYASSSWTRTSVATLWTGLGAGTHGVLDRPDILSPRFESLPSALQRAGYVTRAWSSNPNILPLWGFDSGVDLFVDLNSFDWMNHKADAGEIFAAVRAALADTDALPTFNYIHLMDPHAPYRPDAQDLEAVLNDDHLSASFPGGSEQAPTSGGTADATRSQIRADYARYLAEIRGMDRDTGAFLDDLRRRGLYDSALILFLADHGEEFLDHGGRFHGVTLYQEMLHVPVILKLPGNRLAGSRVSAEIGLADLAPTVLGILGAGTLPDADGRNLWDPTQGKIRDESAAQNAILKLEMNHKAALVSDTRKLIVNYRGAPLLFDLRTDPGERQNLLPERAVEAGELRSELDSMLSRREAGWHLRVCGGDDDFHIRLQVKVQGVGRGSLLEEDDEVLQVADESPWRKYDVAFHLLPRNVKRETGGQLIDGRQRDEDEITVTPEAEGGLLAKSASGLPLLYSVGLDSERRASAEIDARPEDPSVTIRASDAPQCREETSGKDDPRPYLRIWYIPAGERRAEADVDPAVKERLRALGYKW